MEDPAQNVTTVQPDSLDIAAANATAMFTPSSQDMACAYLSLMLMALIPIFVGSFRSIRHQVNTRAKSRETGEQVDTMTDRDAAMFPVIASCALFGFYILIKLSPDLVNLAVSGYFFILGVCAIYRILRPFTRRIFPNRFNLTQYTIVFGTRSLDDTNRAETSTSTDTTSSSSTTTTTTTTTSSSTTTSSDTTTSETTTSDTPTSDTASSDTTTCPTSYTSLTTPTTPTSPTTVTTSMSTGSGSVSGNTSPTGSNGSMDSDLLPTDITFWSKFTPSDILAFALASILGVWYLFTKHWIANNAFGLAFALNGIELLPVNTVRIGCILLCGLFFYDVFWVFGTDVMVSVAKKFDAPIKIVFPQDFLVNGLWGRHFAMLGLGDIVIPGIFIAFLLRFDRSLERKSNVYFWSCFLAYIFGLGLTIGVMSYFRAAQPALLYLVPCCILVPLFIAVSKGDLGALLKYRDHPLPQQPQDEAASSDDDVRPELRRRQQRADRRRNE